MKKIYLVSYDISSNKKRKKVADKLLYFGLVRMQGSVFMGLLTATLYQQAMGWLTPLFQKEDDLIVLSITETALKQMLNFGNHQADISYISGEQNTLYFA